MNPSDPQTLSRAYIAAQTDSRPRIGSLKPPAKPLSSWWLVLGCTLLTLIAVAGL